jgi:NTP pyrophosphatase (non-canonical NTP hydrolase)
VDFKLHHYRKGELMDRLGNIIAEIVRFRDEREWSQFHTPKNLATALSIEAAELQELMLWKTDREVAELLATGDGKAQLTAEVADVLIFSLLLCERVGVDPVDAMRLKLRENAAKYPVELAKGNATKYSHLKADTRKEG